MSGVSGSVGRTGDLRILPGAPAHECGVFGVWARDPAFPAASVTLMGLTALQHRGQESAGLAVREGGSIQVIQGMGLVSEALPPRRIGGLTGPAAIGHVRYSTSGGSDLAHAQPLFGLRRGSGVALAHNGNLVNANLLRERLRREEGVRFATDLDSEVLLQLFLTAQSDSPASALEHLARHALGGYAVLLLTPGYLAGLRDPHGIRPLVLGELPEGWVLASETCALEAVGAHPVREVGPGEAVVLDDAGVRTHRVGPAGARPAFCVFEFVYFARPDSTFAERNVYRVRREIGRQLARESPAAADLVVPSPDSGVAAALGYAEEAGLPFEMGVVKNHYVGRTFIQPTPQLRERAVNLKLNPVRQVVGGRRVVLVDDSLVRGTTSARLVRLLRESGAREVHVRIASPPYINPCHYGIDTPDTAKLVAHGRTLEEVRQAVGADSLAFLSQEGLLRAVGLDEEQLCTACFTRRYPTPLPEAAGAGRQGGGCGAPPVGVNASAR